MRYVTVPKIYNYDADILKKLTTEEPGKPYYIYYDFIACLFCFLEVVFEVGSSDYQQAEV